MVTILSDPPNHSTLHFPFYQAMMGLSDMDHMVAEAVTSEQAIGGLELGHDLLFFQQSWQGPIFHFHDYGRKGKGFAQK